MKIRINLVAGDNVEFETPEDFDFQYFCTSIRAAGQLLSSGLYIPHDNILSIHVVGVTPSVKGMVRQ